MNFGANFGKALANHTKEKRDSFAIEIRKAKKNEILDQKRKMILNNYTDQDTWPIDISKNPVAKFSH